MNGKKAVVVKVLKIIGNVFLYLFLAVCFAMLLLTVTARKNKDGTPVIFGHEIRVILSNSMEKCDKTDVSNYEIKDLPVRSAIFIEVVPTDPEEAKEWYSSLKEGDVVTFKYVYVKQETITHRIVDIEKSPNGGYLLTLEGDNKAAEGTTLKQVIDTGEEESFNYVIGKVTGKSVVLGNLIYIMERPVGIICLVIVPSVIIIIWEVIRIIDAVNKNKKKKLEEESVRKESEIENLKRRLAELENRENNSDKQENNLGGI